MSRPFDWAPLAGTDPVPGRPSDLEQGAEHYSAVADSAEHAHSALDSVANAATMRSDAVEALRDRAIELRADIEKVDDRYRKVAHAIASYAIELREAQSTADGALVDARRALHARDQAEGDHRYYTRLADSYDAAGEADRATYYSSLARDEWNTIQAKEGDIAYLRDDVLAGATKRRDQAAENAISAIDRATDDGLNDGWWQNWGSDVASIVSSVAGTIAGIAGIAALVLCWVPVLGQALAAVALVAGAVALVADVALAATGEKSWADAAMGVVALATFGVGRAAGTLFKASQAARATTMTSQGSRVMSITAAHGARSGTTAAVAAGRVTTASTGSRNVATTFSRSNLTAAAKDPFTVGREAMDVFRPGTYTHWGQGWRNVSQGTVGERLSHVFVGDDAAQSLAAINSARASRAAAMADAGMPAPNSFAFAAAGTTGTTSIQYSVSGSFDAVAGAGGAVATAPAIAGAVGFDAYSVATGGSPVPTSFEDGTDLGDWFTGEEDERSAPYRLGLR